MSKYTVFLSHAHADNDLSDPYAEKLSKWGVDVWYDRTNMDPASLIPETIANELQKRTALIVMLTPHAVRSKWVMKFEVGTFITFWANAGDEERIVLPVMLTDCEVPPILQSFNRIDASLLGQDETCSAIAKALGVEPPVAPPLSISRSTSISRALSRALDVPAVPRGRRGRASRPLRRSWADWEHWEGDGWEEDDDTDELSRALVPSPGAADDPQAALKDYVFELERLLDDWFAFTEEKWRAVSDSQLGWKPLYGRYNGWEEIYKDVFTVHGGEKVDNTERRFDNAQMKGSAASAVAGFLRDLDVFRQARNAITDGKPQTPRIGKAPIIRNPMIVDADRPASALLCDQCGSERPQSGLCPKCGAPPPSKAPIIRNPMIGDAD